MNDSDGKVTLDRNMGNGQFIYILLATAKIPTG